jgi:hypothetical protein
MGGLSPGGAAWLAAVLDPYHDLQLELKGLPDHCEAKTVVRKYQRQIQISAASFGLGVSANFDMQVALLPILIPIKGSVGYVSNTGGSNFDGGVVYDNANAAAAPELNTFPGDYAPTAPSEYLYPLTISGALSAAKHYPNGGYDVGFTFESASYIGLAPYQSTAFTATTLNGGVIVPDSRNSYRLIGAGFEVTNATPDQFIGGTVTTYRINSEFDQEKVNLAYWFSDSLVWPGGNPAFLPVTIRTQPIPIVQATQIISLPLDNTSQAAILPGTKTWSAVDGCYVVQAMDPECITHFTSIYDTGHWLGVNQFPLPAGNINAIFSYHAWRRPRFNYVLTFSALGALDPALSTTEAEGMVESIYPTAGQTCGALFQGLSGNSSFTVTATWIIESCPTFDNENDITLAGVSAPYDPQALELYARTIRSMPTGVPVNQNPLGEWFETIMALVKSNAASVGGMIGTTLAGAPGAALGGIFGSAIGNAAGYLGASNKRRRLNKDF